MAGKKENLKALFSNARTRVIILFTVALMILTIAVGYYKFKSSTGPEISGASVSGTPGGIRSIPGSADPSAQYAFLQEKQNVEQAKAAAKKGGSAIPTIVRSQAFGEGVEAVGPQKGKGGLGFTALNREDTGGPQQSLWQQELKDSNCSEATVKKVMNQGAGLSDLKAVCTCTQLKADQFSLEELQQVCSCPDLRVAGFNATQLKAAGYSAVRLKNCGFDACELKGAGFSAQELKDAGFTDGELKGAGYTDAEIGHVSGLPAGVTEADVRKAGCQTAAIEKLRAEGVTAAAIRRINGCSAAQLKAAGYSAKDLMNAGFTAAELKQAGFTAAQLKAAGFTARDLMNAGFTPAELAAAGYSPAQIKAAEAELPPGITPEDVKNAGCSESALKRERQAGVSAKLIREYAECSAAALKNAGFSDPDLANAGFTPDQIAATNGKITDAEIRAAGCDPTKLQQLFKEGVSAQRIHALNGCSAAALKAAGFTAKELADAGFTPAQLLAAGFTPQQLADSGAQAKNCSVQSLEAARASGESALTIRNTLGCSAAALKAAGYTAAELKAAGFTAAELKAAGFTANQLKNAGFSASELRAAGFTAQQLKDAGFNAAQLKDAGFSAAELKAAGFSAAQLKAAGFSAEELKDAGFSAAQLRQAGYSAKDLRKAGLSMDELRAAGFSNDDLKAAGFDLKKSALAALTGAPPQIPSEAILPSIGGAPTPQSIAAENSRQLNAIMDRQRRKMAEQQYQQKIQQMTGVMTSAANQALQGWKTGFTQVYVGGSGTDKKGSGAAIEETSVTQVATTATTSTTTTTVVTHAPLIRAGEVLFAVMDTSVNSDEPGPILATIVSDRFKGAKLIGSFNLPSNAEKMVITFNMMSVPGAAKTTAINAYAIDPNTARTALSSRTDHHYLTRYGALFAATFIEGFGNAFQSAGTTITIGGSGGAVQNTSIQSGVGRSVLQNAVIGLATVGKNWGQVAMQNVNMPTTVQVFSGTGVGVLFTQDISSL